MHKATRKQSISLSVVTMFLSGIMVASAAYGQKTSKDTPDLLQAKLHQVLELDRQLIDSENSKDFETVKTMVWQSDSALFVAKTATAAEGNWAGFWGHDVVVAHLHDVIFGGPFRIDPDYTKEKAVLLNTDVAETYVPVQITVGYGGQQAVPKPFLILIDWVKTAAGWKMGERYRNPCSTSSRSGAVRPPADARSVSTRPWTIVRLFESIVLPFDFLPHHIERGLSPRKFA